MYILYTLYTSIQHSQRSIFFSIVVDFLEHWHLARLDMSTYCCTQFVVSRQRMERVPDGFWSILALIGGLDEKSAGSGKMSVSQLLLSI